MNLHTTFDESILKINQERNENEHITPILPYQIFNDIK
jgi:hypothetical protein